MRGLADEIPWRRVAGLRDVLAHAYFGLDEDIVWSVVAEEVPLPTGRRNEYQYERCSAAD